MKLKVLYSPEEPQNSRIVDAETNETVEGVQWTDLHLFPTEAAVTIHLVDFEFKVLEKGEKS